MSKSFAALAILIGTMIGAGILGIPYVVSKSGFPIGVFHIIFIAVIMAVVMLYLGEIALRTKKNHQLAGYAEKYLGESGKKVMFIAVAFGIYAAIIAYLIAEGSSLSYLLFNNASHQLSLGIIFWAFMSLITYFGIKALEEGEIVGVSLVFVMIISIAAYFASKSDFSALTNIYPNNLFIPFGVILFAFLGFAAVPEIKRVLEKDTKSLKGIIITAHVLVAIVYLVFTAIVLGYAGDGTPEIATLGLGKPFVFLGMLTMFTAYLSLSMALIDSFRFDFNKSRKVAWLYTISVPLVIFILLSLAGKAGFTNVLGIGGVISGGMTAILILLMVNNAKKHGDIKPSYSMPASRIFFYIASAIFAIGALVEIMNIIY